MDKYQEALNNFKGYKNICEHMKFDEDIATLQELVDNYSKLLKALDKACEKIQFYDGLFPRSLTTKMSKEEWKEWLLKDER